MSFVTETVFREDAYRFECDAEVVAINDRGGIILNRTVFYGASGGQPGDTGLIRRADGQAIAIAATLCGATKDEIIHIPLSDNRLPRIGEKVGLEIDSARRLNLMRMHTACHLLTVVCPYPITGAAVGEEESRVDFDLPELSVDKQEISTRLMNLVSADHPVYTRMISQADLAANPGLVKSKNVRPPVGSGQIRLVCIGENESVDSQPCGGTHVRSTAEIGTVHIGKIEKKGRENRRFRIRFGSVPQ